MSLNLLPKLYLNGIKKFLILLNINILTVLLKVKTIKLNLQNDLLLVDDIPVNKKAKADIQIMASGAVNSVKITYSSGSRTVDDTILKVINETLSYMKPPKHGIIAKPVVITLCLDLN